MAEKKVVELEVNTNLGSLKSQLKQAQIEVQTLSDKFGATSKEAVEAAKKAAELKDRIGDAKALTDAFNPDAKFKALSGALTGVAGGFSVVTGALAAFGKQNEDVEKALLKVQGAMALASGAQAIGESIDSFKQLSAVIKSTTVFQGIYNLVQTGSIKGLAQSTTAKVADTQATVAQGTATVATTAATTGASVAMKVLRAALISTGIGALVVGIGLLIANFDSLKEKFNNLGAPMKMFVRLALPIIPLIEGIGAVYNYFMADSIALNAKSEASVKKNTKALDAQIKANEKASEALKTKNGHEYNMAKATGASTEALRKLALKHADEVIALDKASLATARNTYEKEKNTLANMRNNGVSDEIIEKQVELVKKSRENVTKEREDLEKSYEAKKEIVRNNEVEIATEIFDKKQKIKDNNKSVNDKIKADNEKAAEDEKNRIKQLNTDITNLNEELRVSKLSDEEKEQDALNKKYDKLIEDGKKANIDVSKLEEEKRLSKLAIEKKYDDIEIATQKELDLKKAEQVASEKQRLNELTKTEDELKLIKLEADYKAEQLLYKDNAEILLALKKKFDEDVEKTDIEAKQKKEAILKEQLDLIKGSFQSIADIATLFAGKNKKSQKAAFEVQKVANIAQATIDTFTSAQAAYKSAVGVPVIGPALAVAAAAGAVAVGLSNIRKISQTRFESPTTPTDSGGGGDGGTTAPTMSAPQFNVVGQSGINQLASLNQQPIQAYVVSGQVTSQQALDRNRLENATLGG